MQFLTLARTLIDLDDDVGGVTTRAANLHLDRKGLASAMDEIQPSPTKAYMTISQVSYVFEREGSEQGGSPLCLQHS